MRRLLDSGFLHFLSRLFVARIPEEDHLTGAVDLSDSAYCLGLLACEPEGKADHSASH